MGNYFSEMNCIKATVITETNNEPYFDEVKKDENILEEVKEPNPIFDKKEECCDKKECCDIEDCCKNKESCDKKDCPKKDCCKKQESCDKKEEKINS
jgi:hypothetical protein